jgi:hypothetical protein
MVFRVYGVVCAAFLVLFVLVNLYNRDEGSFTADLNDEVDPTVRTNHLLELFIDAHVRVLVRSKKSGHKNAIKRGLP